MTVQTTSSRAGPFIGNGVTDQWSTNFLVDKADDLSVIYTDPSGVDSTLDQAQYSVVGFGDPAGVTVTYPTVGTPIGPNEKITLLREVDYDQQTSITNQGGFYPTVIEKALDRIVFQCQQLAEKLGRALLFPVSTRADFDAQLPQPQASTVLGFNALGTGFEIYPINAEIIDPSALPAFIGDSGEGGTKGVVPAPSAGDGAANKLLSASGGWVSLGTAAAEDVGTAAGNIPQLDGDGKMPAVSAENQPMTGRLLNTIIYTESGVYPKNDDASYIEVELVGGGSAGGTITATTTGGSAAGGGSEGGYSRKRIANSSVAATETVTIGDGGSPNATASSNGGNGGTTSFGSHFSATGATGGSGAGVGTGTGFNGSPGTPGVGVGGDINLPGTAGGRGFISGGTNSTGGDGGGSRMSGRVVGPITNSGSLAGNAGSGYGGGGTGAAGGASATVKSGGAGTPGIVIVREYR